MLSVTGTRIHKRLPFDRLTLYEYAVEGAKTELGLGLGFLDEAEEERLRLDISALEERIMYELAKTSTIKERT